MSAYVNLVELQYPAADLTIAFQTAELILEIGNYKTTRDVPMVLGEMAGRTTVAALDGYEQVVGTAGLRIVEPSLATIEDVVSAPRKRGSGIGRIVVEAVEEVALRQGVIELNLESSLLAAPFYKHLDYDQLNKRFFRKFL